MNELPEDGELSVAVELANVCDALSDALEDCEARQGDDAINTLRWCRAVLDRLVWKLS